MTGPLRNSESELFKESLGLFTTFLKVFTDSLDPFFLNSFYKLKKLLGM